MKQLLFILLLLPLSSTAQLVFEVNSPDAERGIFPCMAGKNSEWINSPNLYQNGNWFSDTLLLADDGTSGSACSSLINTISGNFVLFERVGCDLGQSLLYAQNAGATGAIVIDSVDGRPLPFDPDGLSDSISIPFVIISERKGDSLMQRIMANDTIIVSFGDKTGNNTVDVGMYKEFSLWSRYAVFPFGSHELPDDHFGTWVYNHGTTDATNLQVKLWFYHNDSYPNHNRDSLSLPFDLAAGDSTFIHFDYEYAFAGNGYSIHVQQPLNYGYEILGITDDDTLDNKISSIIYSDDEIISTSYPPNFSNSDFSDVDYFIEGISASYDSIGHCLYMPIKLTNDHASFCNPTITLANGDFGAENALTTVDVNIGNQQVFFDTYYGQGFYYVSNSADTVFVDFDDWSPGFGSNIFNQSTDLVLTMQIASSTKLGFSSDMYHDEQIRQGYLPTYFRKNMTNTGGNYTPQYILTPILSLNMSVHSNCFWIDLEEIESAQVAVFPNPTISTLTISSDEVFQEITVYDLFGKLILTHECANDTEVTLDTEHLKNGCYLLEVSSGNDRKSVHRFLKE